MSRLWMVAYDISDDHVRREVRELLKDHGVRVQYSVFECFLQAGEKEELHLNLGRLIDQGDSIRWYPLCRWCREKIIRQGRGAATGDPEYYLL